MSKKILSFDDIVSRSIVIRANSIDASATLADDRAKPIDEILDDPEARYRVLEALGLNTMSRSAALHLLGDTNGVPEALKGIGRIGVAPFLEAASARSEPGTSNLRVKVGGQVRDHIFIPDPSDPSDCPSSGRGHLSVDVLHEFFDADEDLRACRPNKTEFYHWDIEISKYEVHKRYDLIEELKDDHGYFPNNPFPTLPDIAFPASALDPDDPRSIWCRCLDHKLYATGKRIKVDRVYRQICNHPAGPNDEDFRLLDPDHPQDGIFYEQSNDACIDIMFAGYPPLAGLPKQREYCLGRCENPAIVNTGA